MTNHAKAAAAADWAAAEMRRINRTYFHPLARNTERHQIGHAIQKISICLSLGRLESTCLIMKFPTIHEHPLHDDLIASAQTPPQPCVLSGAQYSQKVVKLSDRLVVKFGHRCYEGGSSNIPVVQLSYNSHIPTIASIRWIATAQLMSLVWFAS
jgi:hypothetical protein